MGRRLVSRTGRLLLAAVVAAAVIAVGSRCGWWAAVTGHPTAAWNWVERLSWFCAVGSLVLMVHYEHRARRTDGADGDDRRIMAFGFFNRIHMSSDQPNGLARQSDPVVLARDKPVNHDPERARLEEELTRPRSGVVLVYGPAGAGKTTLVEAVLGKTDLRTTREGYDLTAGGGFGAAELVRILSKDTATRAMGLRDDALQRLEVALEAKNDPAVAVVIDGAQRLLEPETNRIADLDLNEAMAVIAARRNRRVKVILITRDQPVAAANSAWTTDDAVPILVTRLSADYFEQYLEVLDPADSAGIRADSEHLCDLLQGLPRNANLFWAALTLPVDRPSATDLARQLSKAPRRHRARVLARTVVDSLTPEQRRLVAALVAYDMPVTSEDVRELLDNVTSPVRAEQLLDHLAEHHVVVRLPAPVRYCVTDPEILAAFEGGENELEDLRRRAALLLSLRRNPPGQVHGPDDLAVQFTELRIAMKGRDWLSAYDRIKELDSYLIRWNASGLLMEYRTSVAGKLEDDFEELRNYNALGYSSASRGYPEKARNAYRRAFEKAQTQDRPDESRRKIITNLADLDWQCGDTREAERQYREALDLAVRDGDDSDRIVALSGLADCRRRHGDHRQAVDLGKEALSLARANDSRTWQVDLSIKVARWLSEQNARGAAWELIAQADEIAREGSEPTLRARCLDGRADLYLDEGDFVTAQVDAAEAVRRALGTHDPVTVLQARTTLAMAAFRSGDIEVAQVQIQRASWYRRENRSLIVLALQALIAFRQDADGVARKLFEQLEGEAVRRREQDREDFGAWELEGIAICGSDADPDGRADQAKFAFDQARLVAPDFPVVKERLRFMLGVVALRATSYRALAAAATGTNPPLSGT